MVTFLPSHVSLRGQQWWVTSRGVETAYISSRSHKERNVVAACHQPRKASKYDMLSQPSSSFSSTNHNASCTRVCGAPTMLTYRGQSCRTCFMLILEAWGNRRREKMTRQFCEAENALSGLWNSNSRLMCRRNYEQLLLRSDLFAYHRVANPYIGNLIQSSKTLCEASNPLAGTSPGGPPPPRSQCAHLRLIQSGT